MFKIQGICQGICGKIKILRGSARDLHVFRGICEGSACFFAGSVRDLRLKHFLGICEGICESEKSRGSVGICKLNFRGICEGSVKKNTVCSIFIFFRFTGQCFFLLFYYSSKPTTDLLFYTLLTPPPTYSSILFLSKIIFKKKFINNLL